MSDIETVLARLEQGLAEEAEKAQAAMPGPRFIGDAMLSMPNANALRVAVAEHEKRQNPKATLDRISVMLDVVDLARALAENGDPYAAIHGKRILQLLASLYPESEDS